MDSMIELRPGRHIKLSLESGPAGQPTLFLLHGLGGRGGQWREQVKFFKNKYTLVVPDLLGHGDSDKPKPEESNPYEFAALSQDIQALFEKFAGSTNYVLGHSYGGAFASYLAAHNPKRIQKLVLITPLSCQPFHQVPLIYLLPLTFLEHMRTYLDSSFEKLAFAPHAKPSLLAEEKAARALNEMYVIKSLLLGMKDIPELAVASLTMPTLILAGRLDRVIPLAAVQKFYGRLAQQHLVIFEDAAHMVQLEKSFEVNTLLEQFFFTS